MKILINGKMLLLACLVMSAAAISSCKKDKSDVSSKIELLSFGPTGAMPGDTLRFIGHNLNKVTEIALTNASVASTAFLSQTPELILIIVPQSTEQGYVTLKTPEGDIVSKTMLNLEVPVTVTSITASARPGENITIKGNYLNWVTSVTFAKDKWDTNFVSKSLTELVIKVPMDAQSGTLILSTGGTEPLTIETDSSLNVVLPMATGLSPIPIERQGELTITGTDLDLVMGVMFKGIDTAKTIFVSKSATKLVIKVPEKANKGKITLVAYSGLKTESTQSVLFIGDLPDLAPLAYAMYEDNLVNNWQDWGWGRTADYKSADNVRDGEASMKVEYTGEWSGIKFANSSVSTANYSELTFSIFGTPGTGGKKIDMKPNGGAVFTITLEEGKWVEYRLTKAQIGNPATLTELMFQNQAWKGTVFFDKVGLR